MNNSASFHLVTWPGALGALARLGTDRLSLKNVEGLQFWRLLGTGSGSNTSQGANLRRTALFAVWRDEQCLQQFLEHHPIARRWKQADESWHVKLRGVGGHGSWRGFAVADELTRGETHGPIAMITRADVRPRSWKQFRQAGEPGNIELHQSEGLLAVVGIGEAPIGRLGTFSLWSSLDAMRRFATEAPQHQAVVQRTRTEEWYGEELFARFEPYGSTGTWDGVDPLAR
jgi:heme-degrading monooxygenase HmoA